MEKSIQLASEQIREAEGILIGAGAGIGVDSGLPDFRGNEGFWRAYPPIAKLGIGFQEMANPRWFERDPSLAWGFYGHRLNLYRQTIPHEGFEILKQWSAHLPLGAFVYTSNVDGHFQKAGFDSEKIIECHGSLNHFQCVTDCKRMIWPADQTEVLVDEERLRAAEPHPECPHCRGLARPNVLMFGDWGWNSSRTEEQDQRFRHWQQQASDRKIVSIEIGAGTAVPSVRHACEQFSTSENHTLIRINPRESEAPRGSISIPLKALDAITAINEKWLS